MLNGKRIDLSEEQVQKITESAFNNSVLSESNNPFIKAKGGSQYYYINGYGEVNKYTENDLVDNIMHYNIANYCTDSGIMYQRALHEALNRLLWRYSEEHDGDPEWNYINRHWFIYCRKPLEFEVACQTCNRRIETVYFARLGIAVDAIRYIIKPFLEAHPEFVF